MSALWNAALSVDNDQRRRTTSFRFLFLRGHLHVGEENCEEQHREEETGEYEQCHLARLPAAFSGAASLAASTAAVGAAAVITARGLRYHFLLIEYVGHHYFGLSFLVTYRCCCCCCGSLLSGLHRPTIAAVNLSICHLSVYSCVVSSSTHTNRCSWSLRV